MQKIKRIRLGRIIKDQHRSDQSIGFQISRELFNFKHGPTRDLIAVSRFLIISIQQQQMFAFFLLYQRRVNEYMTVLNFACMRRRRTRLRRMRVAPYAWTIPRPANSWFHVHCNDPRIPQEYFPQLLGVNKDTFDTVLLTPETGKGKFVFQRLFPTAESSGFGTVSFGPQEFVFNHHCASV